jgi:hypothetical protein
MTKARGARPESQYLLLRGALYASRRRMGAAGGVVRTGATRCMQPCPGLLLLGFLANAVLPRTFP